MGNIDEKNSSVIKTVKNIDTFERVAYRFSLSVESFKPRLQNLSCVILPLNQWFSSDLTKRQHME
jgi:hypothetical protein